MKFPSFGRSSKKYKCEYCAEKFKTETELEDHRIKEHPDKKP